MSAPTLIRRARAVLETADPLAKASTARVLAEDWISGAIIDIGEPGAPERPSRPARPELRAPRDMPKRRAGKSAQTRIALLHALAHIELNAIDLAADIVARFAHDRIAPEFITDWLRVAAEEARHFEMIHARLLECGAAYGDLSAHDGLWEAAAATTDDILARLAIVPLVLEARGLDVTPTMIARMRRFGDDATADLLGVVYRDEIGHVAIGHKWFERVARERGMTPRAAWRQLAGQRFRGALKAPFNETARAQAGLTPDWYRDLRAPGKNG